MAGVDVDDNDVNDVETSGCAMLDKVVDGDDNGCKDDGLAAFVVDCEDDTLILSVIVELVPNMALSTGVIEATGSMTIDSVASDRCSCCRRWRCWPC